MIKWVRLPSSVQYIFIMENLRKTNETKVEYKGSNIYSFTWEWEEDNGKGKMITKKEVICHLYRLGSKKPTIKFR